MKLFTGVIAIFLALCSTSIAAQSAQSCEQINQSIYPISNRRLTKWPQNLARNLGPDVIKDIVKTWTDNRDGFGFLSSVYDKQGRRIEFKNYWSQIVITQICQRRRRRYGLNMLGDYRDLKAL